MTYYIIEKDLDPKITGIRSGSSQGKIDTHLFREQPWVNQFLYGEGCGLRAGEFPPFEFKLEGIWLDKRARLTDFVSIGALLTGFIVNQKVLDILLSCHLPPYKVYEVSFDQAGKIISGYYWFYFNLLDGSKWVNFEKSVFDTSQEEKLDQQVYEIKSYQDYMALTLKHQRGVVPTSLVFGPSFDHNLDVFGMRFLGNKKYISDRLKQKLEKQNIKGHKVRIPGAASVDVKLKWDT